MSTDKKKTVKLLAGAGLILTTIIWGGAFVVMKNSVDLIPPCYLLGMRFTIAAVCLFGVFWPQNRGMTGKDVQYGVILGIFLFISYFFQTYGLKYTTASKNAFITTLYVIIVPFLHWLFNQKRPSVRNLGAAAIAVAGLALLSLEGDLSINLGDFLTLVCGVFFAVHIVFVDRYTADHSPIRLTTIQMVTCGVLGWILAPVIDGGLDLGVLNGGLVMGLLYLGIFSTMLGYLFQNVGQKYLTPNTSSILLSFESVFGLVFSVLFLGDPVTARLLAGCALMFAAVVLSEYTPKRRAAAS